MHTAWELINDAFDYYQNDEPVGREDVLPPISVADRLGVVMADSSDGLGAGNFVLACVTAFYDRLPEHGEDFYEYADYYTFQAGDDLVNYLEFDIWPAHKQVAVPRDPERILRAVNDRAVNILLVPTGADTDPELADTTLNSARRRIDVCYQYARAAISTTRSSSLRSPRTQRHAGTRKPSTRSTTTRLPAAWR